MKKTAKRVIEILVRILVGSLANMKLGRYVLDCVGVALLRPNISLGKFGAGRFADIRMCIAGSILHYRATSYQSKEPMTIRWLSTLDPSTVLFDIGANVGLYSLIAAKSGASVFSFEPNLRNLVMLRENCVLNPSLSNRICIIPLPLYSSSIVGDFSDVNSFYGAAHNQFSESTMAGEGGSPKSVSFSLCDLTRMLSLPVPTHIKLDVDGNEFPILTGGSALLSGVREILVEVDQSRDCEISQILKECGFTLVETESADPVNRLETVTNQLWRNKQWN